ncbi:glycerophosphodiester phosphodiesterase family protein [Frigoribacterium sp. PhB24]|uniref:glycerophosphodiester phosphodiesterase n=1 Tax=Frigoribacterium sp. PhB24 TaxID=2485204 RepID=UPI000F492F86|nr:glycerophosphodiester phosphodiesterase family protein [Frigoribacterium sp. PhB24]ROS51532.1 glycerophosphoryl diester phosphodiesterase family protein [Frigoribacterium sp. PhB24]
MPSSLPPRSPVSRRAVLLAAGGVAVLGAAGTGVALRNARLTEEARVTPTAPPRAVDALRAARPATVAHRGGSRDWPEMSLFAYRQSVAAGVDGLEMSLARTSDGVWFGLHDETLDRTSGTSGFVAAEHTWSEVQRYRISAAETSDTGQSDQPYARFDEIVREFGREHALFVDPKYVAPRFYPELFEIARTRLGTADLTQTLVGKGYCTQTDWGDLVAAEGCATWGYYYADELAEDPELLTRTSDSWSMLGLDWSAPAATWATMTATGKPVLGHIVSDLDAARAALDGGASGLVVSGVAEVVRQLTTEG